MSSNQPGRLSRRRANALILAALDALNNFGEQYPDQQRQDLEAAIDVINQRYKLYGFTAPLRDLDGEVGE